MRPTSCAARSSGSFARSARVGAELAASNRELEQFAYVASHDLQEPLRKVTAFCQMLQQRYGGQLDERADSYINFAVDGATRMQALINDLLTLSRVGRTSGSTAEVELDDVVARAVLNVSESIDEAERPSRSARMPVVQRRAHAADRAVPEPDQQRGQVPRPGASPRGRRSPAGGDGEPLRVHGHRQRHRHRPQYQDRVFVVFQRLHTARSTTAPASAWRSAARSSSITAAGCGSPTTTSVPGPLSASPFPTPTARSRRP